MGTVESKSILAANFGPALLPVIDLTESIDANKGKKITIDIIKAYIEGSFNAKVYHGRPSGNQAYTLTQTGYTALLTNHIFILEFQTSNSSDDPTLNISGLGANNIKIFDETLGSPDYRNLTTGEIQAGLHYLIGWEDTGGGFWKILNYKAETSKVSSAEKGATNGVATLGADGKIPEAQLPSLAITDVIPAADASLALFCANTVSGHSIQKGDVVIINGATPAEYYMFTGGDPGDPADYIQTSISRPQWSSIQGIPAASTSLAGIVQLVNTLNSTDTTKALTAAMGKSLADNKADKLNIIAETNLEDGNTFFSLSGDHWKTIIKLYLNDNLTETIDFDAGQEGLIYEVQIRTGDNGYTNVGWAANVKSKDNVPILIPDNGGTHIYTVYHDGTGYWVEPQYDETV